MKTVQTLIIGGGISGLSSAWQLNQMGQEIAVWEAKPRLGGKISTHFEQGYTTERSASMVLNFRPEVSDFLKQTGLDNHKLLRTPTARRYVIHQGILQEIPMKMAGMLFSPLWSLPGKLRLMLEPFILKGASQDESVADFIRRRLGQEMLDKALSAYISGTLASDPELADSLSVLPHLTALEQRYGSLTAGVFARKVINRKKAAVTEGFSFRGGMSTLIDELSKLLAHKIRTGYSIKNICRHGKYWLVTAQTSQGEQNCLAENLVLTTPAPISARLLDKLNPDLAGLLQGIEYASVSVVHLGYHKQQIKHPLEGTGFLTPWREKLKLNGSMWMHSLFNDRAPQDHVLLSNYMGGVRHPEIASWCDSKRIDTASRELKTLLGINGVPDWARVDFHQQALPLYHGKYTLRQQMIANQLENMPGLHLNANYLGGVSIRDRIVCAQNLALELGQHSVIRQERTRPWSATHLPRLSKYTMSNLPGHNEAGLKLPSEERPFNPLHLIGFVLLMLLGISLWLRWYTSAVSMPRYCDNPADSLYHLEKVLTEQTPAKDESRRPYIIAAKLIYIIPDSVMNLCQIICNA